MSDPAPPPAPSPVPEAAPAPAASPPPAPPADRGPKAPEGIVYGTSALSAWQENEINVLEAARKEAIRESDAEVAEAKGAYERGAPEEAGFSHTKDLGRPGQNPVVVIYCTTSSGQREQFMQCDLNVAESNGEVSLSLNMICPRCVAKKIPQARCQIKIDSRNKKLSIDESTKGTPWIDPDTGTIFNTAGTVEVDEVCRCPQPGCGFRFRISPKGPTLGISRLVAE